VHAAPLFLADVPSLSGKSERKNGHREYRRI
jgi:hypothetical protein